MSHVPGKLKRKKLYLVLQRERALNEKHAQTPSRKERETCFLRRHAVLQNPVSPAASPQHTCKPLIQRGTIQHALLQHANLFICISCRQRKAKHYSSFLVCRKEEKKIAINSVAWK